MGQDAMSLSFPGFQKVKKVVGIELCQEAVEDARVNAQDNGESQHPTKQVGSRCLCCMPQHSTWDPPGGS